MIELNSRQRKMLERYANVLQPVVIVGQNGVTAGLEEKVKASLEVHELIKVKFNEFKDEKYELVNRLCVASDAVLIRIIGNVAIIFRQNPDSEKQKYDLSGL